MRRYIAKYEHYTIIGTEYGSCDILAKNKSEAKREFYKIYDSSYYKLTNLINIKLEYV